MRNNLKKVILNSPLNFSKKIKIDFLYKPKLKL